MKSVRDLHLDCSKYSRVLLTENSVNKTGVIKTIWLYEQESFIYNKFKFL